MPLKLAQQKIELNTSIPPTHQSKYKMNLNYVVIIKHNIDKLLVVGSLNMWKKQPSYPQS